MKKIIFLSLACSCIFGSGYKIPEQSGDSVAMSAANIAKSFGADASYYNPANMVFLNDARHLGEIGGTLIYLKKAKYVPNKENGNDQYAKSKDFSIVAPNLHFVSPEYFPNLRFGLSFAVPAGMTMRWEEEFKSKAFAKEFQLKVFEINPSVAYRFSDQFSAAFGLRAVYSKGVVKNQFDQTFNRDITGDSVDFGYNLAFTYKPTQNLSFAATYRSNVDLTLKGDADIDLSTDPCYKGYHDKVSVEIPLPATLNLATSYTLNKTTFLATYERIFWSKFKNIDFEYDKEIHPGLKGNFDDPVIKNWKDTNAYRFAIAHELNDEIRLMAGFAYDESVSKDKFVGFELPESKAFLYSAGINYKFSDNLQTGLSYLYQDRQNRNVKNTHQQTNGKFINGDVQLVNLNLKFTF